MIKEHVLLLVAIDAEHAAALRVAFPEAEVLVSVALPIRDVVDVPTIRMERDRPRPKTLTPRSQAKGFRHR